MKSKLNQLSAIVLSAVLLFSMSLTAYAHDVPDMNRLGSITITTRKGDTIVKGGTMTIYRVGEVVENDGNYTFQPTGEFASCGESFEDLDDAEAIASRLKTFADDGDIPGMATKEIGSDGSVTFDSLPLGLYLVVQHKAAPGYAKLAPFLVSLPYMDDGEYKYELAARPKPDLEQEPEPTDPPPTKPTDPSLPQTGQLWWPVPVLAVAGMAFFTVGWVLFVNKGKKHEE